MPEHYAVVQVDQVLQAVQDGYRYIKSPLAGFVQDAYYSVGSNLPTDAVFDIRKNGASLWAADPSQRPKILAGASSGQKLAINAALAVGDLLQLDLKTVPAGGLPVPFVTRLTLFDAIGLRSEVIFVTASLADQASADVAIPGMGRGWKLVSAEADRACWVRGYVSTAARVADATRLISEDAGENAGLCCEIVFTALLLEVGYGSPFPEGFNLDDPNSTDGIFTIQNLSGGASTVQLTFQRLITER